MTTLTYYNQNAETYVENTRDVDMHTVRERFLSRLIPGAYILDFGCGSGRDTRVFLDLGYRVDAVDGSEELCRRASLYTGITVKRMLFQELDEQEKYDGIWACSSILHLEKEDLLSVLGKMCAALKRGGVIYTSFKYGAFEGERDGRYYTDFTENTFGMFIGQIPELSMEDYWITGDVRPEKRAEEWLNLILRKACG